MATTIPTGLSSANSTVIGVKIIVVAGLPSGRPMTCESPGFPTQRLPMFRLV
jgi:hypothetical protein